MKREKQLMIRVSEDEAAAIERAAALWPNTTTNAPGVPVARYLRESAMAEAERLSGHCEACGRACE